MRRDLAVAGLVVAFACIACSKTSEPEPGAPPTTSSSPTPAPSAPSSASSSAAAAAGDITWSAPPAWKVAPNPSQLRKATYKIPKADGDPEDAELSVSQAGGGVDANIQRWSGQFQGAPKLKVSHREVAGLSVTLVEGHGTFNGGGAMMGGAPSSPKSNWALLGAIVDSVDPPYFFKLTGPEKTVTGARADFDSFVEALRKK